MEEEIFYEKRFQELSKRSFSNCTYTFTDFLGLKEQTILRRCKGLNSYQTFGGCKLCERVIVRFGNRDEMCYVEEYPISCVSITPLSEKFAENISHRDILGSIMGLGVERSKLGDIFINPNGKDAFLFCCNSISEYLCNELNKIRHTSVKCEITEKMPFDPSVNLKEETVRVKSERADCIVSSIYNLSRENSKTLFINGLVFLNGVNIESGKKIPPGSIVSVRGYGRFIYNGIKSISKKGSLWVEIKMFL